MALFSAILKKITIKKPEVIFHIRLHTLWLSSSLILKKYLYASFSFSIYFVHFFVVFVHMLLALHTTQKNCWVEKKIHNARSLLSSY